jgi:hypothetical protein
MSVDEEQILNQGFPSLCRRVRIALAPEGAFQSSPFMNRAFQVLRACAGGLEQAPVFGQAPALVGVFSEALFSALCERLYPVCVHLSVLV